MNIDFNACANFKGNNQSPLFLAEGNGRFRPSLRKIAAHCIQQGLNAVVLRSHSHQTGTDDRWKNYVEEIEGDRSFTYLGNGIIAFDNFYNPTKIPFYLIHGQGLATSAGDIEVLFTDRRIGGRGQNYEIDFNRLMDMIRTPDPSRDESQNPPMVIALQPHQWILGGSIDIESLERVDAFEVYSGLTGKKANNLAQKISILYNKPGVISSNSKILRDMGSSYTTLPIKIQDTMNSHEIARAIKSGVTNLVPDGKRSNSTLSKLVQIAAIAEVKLTGNKD